MSEHIENCLKSSYDPKVVVGTGRGMMPVLQNPDGSLTPFENIVGWAPPGDDHVTQKPRMVINPNADVVSKITKRIATNDGYCPCQPRSEDDSTKCPCTLFITTGNCCCSLFVVAE